jgi:hypothetical protein
MRCRWSRRPWASSSSQAAQARPLAQQRFVGDFDLARADGDQPVGGERREHLGDRLVALALQLGQRHAAAHDGVALALARQAQQEPARDLAALAVQPLVGALGPPRDRAAHAAGVLVSG